MKMVLDKSMWGGTAWNCNPAPHSRIFLRLNSFSHSLAKCGSMGLCSTPSWGRRIHSNNNSVRRSRSPSISIPDRPSHIPTRKARRPPSNIHRRRGRSSHRCLCHRHRSDICRPSRLQHNHIRRFRAPKLPKRSSVHELTPIVIIASNMLIINTLTVLIIISSTF